MEDISISHIPPLNAQLVRKDLGQYGGYSGVNKLFHLLSAVDHLINVIGEDKVASYVNKDLEKLRQYEQKTKNLTMAHHIKSWNQIKLKLDELRKPLSLVQFSYDLINKRKYDLEPAEKKLQYKKAVMKVTPYQFELYYVFKVVMEMSNMQMTTIPTQFFRTQESASLEKTPFTRNVPKPGQQQTTTPGES